MDFIKISKTNFYGIAWEYQGYLRVYIVIIVCPIYSRTRPTLVGDGTSDSDIECSLKTRFIVTRERETSRCALELCCCHPTRSKIRSIAHLVTKVPGLHLKIILTL